MSKPHRLLLPLATLALATLIPSFARATDRYWIAEEDGYWNIATNWNTVEDGSGSSGRPSAGDLDKVNITNGGNVFVSLSEGSILSLGIGSTDGLKAGTLTIESSGKLRINTGGASIRAGSSLIVNGTFTSLNGSIFNVGSSAGAGTVVINTGGILDHQGAGGDNSQLRLAVSGGTGTITIDGGELKVKNNLTLGRSDGSTATVTLQNGGVYTTTALGATPDTSVIFGATSAGAQYTNVKAMFNVGGATTATAAGTFNGVTRLVGFGSTNTNTLNFNHTSSRYEFVDTATDQGIELRSAINVNIRAGVTVFGTADSNYSRATVIENGGTLLANHTANNEFSSTGTSAGDVIVQEGGTLGGIGYVAGATTISGLLKPGDYDYGATGPTHGNLRFRDNVTLTSTATTEILLGLDTMAGSTYSSITTQGALLLDGTLEIRLDDAFSISLGETLEYQLFTATGGITGDFDLYTLPEEWNSLALIWDFSALATTGSLSVTTIPEPSTLLLFVGAMPAMYFLRRRNRAKLPA